MSRTIGIVSLLYNIQKETRPSDGSGLFLDVVWVVVSMNKAYGWEDLEVIRDVKELLNRDDALRGMWIG